MRSHPPKTMQRRWTEPVARWLRVVVWGLLAALAIGCNAPKARKSGPQADEEAQPPPPITMVPTATGRPLRLAIVGDYGDPNPAADRVAAMVRGWRPDLVLTVGDNNYPAGDAATIDANIGKRYGVFIKPYKGRYGPGSTDHNRFFPAMGNHDWYAANGRAYFDWFELPGNERYYDVHAGPVDLFFLDSYRREPDGVDATSRQAHWLRSALARSKSPFRFVLFHHPPFNSGRHTPSVWMRWPFRAWGASMTFAGHDHHYERIRSRGMWHIVTGHGGRRLYPMTGPVAEGSQVRAYGVFGAMRATVTRGYARFESITPDGILVDSFGLPPSHGPDAPKGKPQQLRGFGQAWYVLEAGVAPADDWATAAPVTPWRQSLAPMGHGTSGLKTELKEGTDNAPKTVHFRATVDLKAGPGGQLPKWLRLRLVRDDGARVLINGVEVWRLNLPMGPISAETDAGYNLRWNNETDVVETWILASMLHAGHNELAVSLHQARGAAHDSRFDLALDTWD